MNVKNDQNYRKAVEESVPELVRFVRGLDTGSAACVDFAGLRAAGLAMGDGSIWRVICGRRSASDQVAYYKQGRRVKYETKTALFDPEPYRGTCYVLKESDITNNALISTMAWAGKSYHNWGAAVDLIFRRLGENMSDPVEYKGKKYTAFYPLYKDCGLLDWAAACGVEWGGLWADFSDVAHFQATGYSLPPESMCFDRNMNKDFLIKYNHGGFRPALFDSLKKKTGVLFPLLCAGVGYFAIKKLLNKGGKR